MKKKLEMQFFNLLATLRSWRDSWIYVLANVLSLAAGFSICIIGYFNLEFNQTFNHYFEDADSIFKVNTLLASPEGNRTSSLTPLALAKFVESGDFDVARFKYGSATSHIADRVFDESVGYYDPEFLDIFSFTTSDGNRASFRDVRNVVLHRKAADRLFPGEEAVGKNLEIAIDDREMTFSVSHVIEEYPSNTSFYFTVLVPMEVYEDTHIDNRLSWSHWVDATFVKTDNPELTEAHIDASLKYRNEEDLNVQILRYDLMNVKQWPSHTSSLQDNVFRGSLHPASVLGTVSSAIFVLLLACFNFINTNLALAGKRMKQMAMRKVMGAGRREIKVQLIIENAFLIAASILISVIISSFIFPYYNAMFPYNIVQFEHIHFGPFLLFIGVLIVMVLLLSSLYPANHINNVPVLHIFRGSWKQSSNKRVLGILLSFQFIICFYNVFSLLIFSENAQYQDELDRGYSVVNILNVPAQNAESQRVLSEKLKESPYIEKVSSSSHLVGFGYDHDIEMGFQGELYSVARLQVGDEYLQTIGVRVAEGRGFRKSEALGRSVIVNETFQEMVGENLLGKTMKVGGESYQTIGIVEDFNLKTILLDNKIKPTAIILAPDSFLTNTVVQFSENNTQLVSNEVQAVWRELFPNELYGGFLQERVMKPLKETNNIILNINGFVAIAALLISVIGLYSAVSLSIQRRIKEFGVRRVLGASSFSIAYLLNKHILIILGISAVLGLTGGYAFIDNLLDTIYAYHLEIGLRHFILPILAIAFSVAAAIGFKVYMTSTSNPVIQLRSE